ncbi:MAG: 6-carboxytetrahydropterin synthase [Planctomycetaceae bacterium]|nr:6-carboxytetrahydropterin synthase [Planctomycetaceae bacterium]
MLELTRTVRFTPTARPRVAGVTAPSASNGLLGVVPPSMLFGVLELDVTCAGEPDATGYLVDIALVDRAVRDHVVPLFDGALRAEAMGAVPVGPGALLATAQRALAQTLPAQVVRLALRPSPFLSTTFEPAMPNAVVLAETFEFAASHRLHLAGRSDEENTRLFGKCNNPNGHGHNYRIEVAVEADADGDFGFPALERIVAREIMGRFDHRHLNLDCPEFRNLNPSVENIARVCHGLLAPEVAAAGAALRFVRVWETDKTSCRYPA